MQTPVFYTPEELASVLKVSQETIRRMCRTQALGARKVGRAWRVPREEAARLVGSLEALEAIDRRREPGP